MHILNPGKAISFQSPVGFKTVNGDHPKFNDIVDLCLTGDYAGAAALYDIKTVVEELVSGSDVKLVGSQLIYNGEAVSGLLGERIVKMANLGLSVDSLIAFLKNLSDNPSSRAVEELYGFLESSKLPITEDGCFLAYKSVNSDYTDSYTGKISNAVGETVTMPRNKVNDNRDQTCSYGLHFAAHEYAEGFGSPDSPMMVLKINPRDVVSIPSDYNNQKGRCCEYYVLEEVSRDDQKLIGASVVDTGSLYTQYTPEVDNYDDRDLWDGEDVFQGDADEFPVNRQTEYYLERTTTSKFYKDYVFCEYDIKHDNLKFYCADQDNYITVSDLTDWRIEFMDIVDSSQDD